MAFRIYFSQLKTSAAIFVGTLVVVKLITHIIRRKRYKLPPGPRGVPILGYLPFFGDKPPVTFNELRRTYGDVISINMGSFPAIVINGRETIKEALVTKGDDFSGRPAFTTSKLLSEGRNLAFANFSEVWKMHRKIVVNVLRIFSKNRDVAIEDIIRSDANTIVEEFLARGRKVANVHVNHAVDSREDAQGERTPDAQANNSRDVRAKSPIDSQFEYRVIQGNDMIGTDNSEGLSGNNTEYDQEPDADAHKINTIKRTNSSEALARAEAEGFCPSESITTAAASIMYQLCYGKHLNIRNDKDFQGILDDNRKFRDFAGAGNPVDVMPWLRFFMPSKVSTVAYLVEKDVARRTIKVKEHEEKFDHNHLSDICDGLLQAGNTLSEDASSLGLEKKQVVESLDIVFAAGNSTIASTLEWLILLMAAFPDIQDKLHGEIDEVVGNGRQPTVQDRVNMPYVEATITEALRFGSPVPMALPHAATKDTTLKGYDIPKGTVVLVNLYSISHDEKLWADPHSFRPERFLDEHGQLHREKVELSAPFSLGRRRCAGEFLARMELFLFFATMMQQVRFFKPPDAPPYELEAVYTLGRDPVPYKICVASRD